MLHGITVSYQHLNRGWLANPMPQSRAVMEIGLVSPPGCKIFLKYFLSFFFCDRTSRWSEIRLFLKCLLWVFSAEMGPRSNKKDRYLVIFFDKSLFSTFKDLFLLSLRLGGNFFPLTFNPVFSSKEKNLLWRIAKLQNWRMWADTWKLNMTNLILQNFAVI